MIRSPISVCFRISSHSISSSGPGLRRISSGIAILPRSWSSAARRRTSTSSASRPSWRPTATARRETLSCWSVSSGSRSRWMLTSSSWVSAFEAAAANALLRVHAAVGEPHGLAGGGRLGREQDGARGGADAKALTLLGQRGPPGRDDRPNPPAARRGEDAELVTAQAVGAAIRARPPRPGSLPAGGAGCRPPDGRSCRCRT